MCKVMLKTAIERLKAFRRDEDGAVTVDFVVLTSSVLLMGLAHAKDVADGTTNIADAVDECLTNDIDQVMNGDPANYVQDLQAAAAACSAR